MRHGRTAISVLLIGVAASIAGWGIAQRVATQEAARHFELDTLKAAQRVDDRLRRHIDLLLGLQGLFRASQRVEREEFDAYLSSSGREPGHGGLRAVTFARYLAAEEVASFERRMRADHKTDPAELRDFEIKPPGARDEYLIIEYVWPFVRNERALGLDLIADPVRRAELAAVRDSGSPIASAPLAAAVDPERVTFVVRAAVYGGRQPLSTIDQRRAAFKGSVAVLIHPRDLLVEALRGYLSEALAVVAIDVGPIAGTRADADRVGHVLFDSRLKLGGKHSVADAEADLQRTMMLDVAGRRWQLTFSTPRSAYVPEQILPVVVLGGGVLTSLLLGWLLWTQSIARERALRLAHQARAMHSAEGLREQLHFIQQLIESIPQPIFFKDAEGHYLGVNKAWEQFFGIPRERFIGKSVFELYPDNQPLAQRHHAKDQELFTRPGSQSYEATIVAADGSNHHTIYNKATFTSAAGKVAGLIGAITDITSLKDAEAALRASEERFRDLTELSSDWYWEQDAAFRIIQVSSKLEAFNLDPAEDIGKRRREFSRLAVPEDHWKPHEADLEARRPFANFEYRRYDLNGSLRTISISGRPIFDEQGRFMGYRGTGRDVTEQKRAEDRIRHLAHYDALTGLPNRVLLNDRIRQGIAHAKRSRRPLALLFIDLDRFKNVNDSLGHAIGDRLLRAVADRLVACTRSTDTVCRLGGDEFIVVLTDLAQTTDCSLVAQKILASLADVFKIDEHELHVTPSIGICAYPQDGQDTDTLMRNADAAMYHAKEMGRNNYQYFTEAMSAAAVQRLALESDLRRAMERGEFVLHYQPQIDVASGRIVGVEALIRWNHPQRGLLGPGAFIGAAEDNGLIVPIGEWVLREACRQVAEWMRNGAPRLQVAVNCSPLQFRRAELPMAVAAILEQEGLPAGSLEIEITESLLVEHSESPADDRLSQLDAIGVRLSLDDFGTGYSSLSYLKRFPIDNLKIDQSFVRDITSDPDDAAIVTAIVAMAHSLGLVVVAEGVESAEQLAFLERLGCDRAQGYYLSRPLTADAFLRVLGESTPQSRASAV